jgi:hypothetical protein
MIRGQRVIVERSCVIRRLRPMLLFAFAFLGFSALIERGRGVIHFLVSGQRILFLSFRLLAL